MSNTTAAVQQAPEWMMYVQVLVALLFVVALIYLSGALARKYGLDKRMAGLKGKESTLSIAETLYLDPRRKLVRVRAGNKEHLLLLSTTGDMVVHSKDVEGTHDAA